MGFFSRFDTGSRVRCLIIGNHNNTLEMGSFRMDRGVIHDDNTNRSWLVSSPPLSVKLREAIKPGEQITYLLDDEQGSTIRLTRIDDGSLATEMDSKKMSRIINDSKILDIFGSDSNRKQQWVNLVMGFIMGGLMIGMIILLFVK